VDGSDRDSTSALPATVVTKTTCHDPDGNSYIRVLDVDGDSVHGNRLFVDISHAESDGFRTNMDGNNRTGTGKQESAGVSSWLFTNSTEVPSQRQAAVNSSVWLIPP